MRQYLLLTGLFSLVLLLALALPRGAQTPTHFEVSYFDSPHYLDPALQAARDKMEISKPSEAYQEAVRVIQANWGTPLEASARLIACEALLAEYPLDTTRLSEQVDRLISGFPGSAPWLAARILRIAHVDSPDDTAEQWRRFEQLISEVGGRPCAEIIDEQPDPPFLETQVPLAYRGHLSQLYSDQADATWLTQAQQDRLMLFLHQSFPSYDGRHRARAYFERKLLVAPETFDGLPPGMPTTPDRTPPRVLSLAPANGAVVAPTAAIEVVVTDGSFWSAQLDTKATRLYVDGQDVTAQSIRQSQINTTNRDADWEVLRLTCRPKAPLAPGSHTVQLVAADLGKNVVQTQWEFSVTEQPLTLAVQVVSKHVKPRKGEVARISVECSRYPVNLQLTVKRGSSTVYQASALDQAKAFEFIWDGKTTSGLPASNGNHGVEIEAIDGSGARATGSANVQVNNNQ